MTAQPPLVPVRHSELTVAIGGLALGGAERIVLDWAARVQPAWRVHLVVLRDGRHEWPVPAGIRVTRLGGVGIVEKLEQIGRGVADGDVPVCLAHLLIDEERRALGDAGAFVVPVVHNAREGWIEDASPLRGVAHVVAVSNAAAEDLRRHGCRAAVAVIRHLPTPRRFGRGAREAFRRAWNIPLDATVIGMIGAVKPQKDYPFAVGLLRRLLEHRDVYLAIVGGPVGRNGRDAWQAVLDAMRAAGVRNRLAMPGFVVDAAAALPAFDILLNTSRYEGTSIATLEALANGVPVVASGVGGQGELKTDGLTLVPKDAPVDDWTAAIAAALERRMPYPRWAGFPSFRLWTLAHLARPFVRDDRVLIVTANLNAGGAQRSLVNLASALRDRRIEIAVAGDSTADYFLAALRAAGTVVSRTAESRDPFDHAERIIEWVCREGIGTICFWNVDPKIKLLATRALAFTDAALVDVSPGPNSFEEMRAIAEFGRLIAFTEADFCERLDRVVVKYQTAAAPVPAGKILVIPNGVVPPSRRKTSYELAGAPRVVVNGRVAPAKFLVEIVQAMALVRKAIPSAELHVFGDAEPRHREYAGAARDAAGPELGRTVMFHGGGGDTAERLADFDVFVVIGREQGCPNALLEALAAGLPCIANDDGGTAEQIVHERTGLLIADRSPETIAAAVIRLVADRDLAAQLGRAGREHVLKAFSMDVMTARYRSLFASLAPAGAKEIA